MTTRAAIVCARSEAHGALGAAGRGAYDVVLARAVAPLAILVELGAPLLAPGGLLLASKTARAVREESAAGEAAAAVCGLASVSVRPLARSQLRDSVCAVYERVAATPERFPRRPGLAGKRPLGV